MVIKNGVPFTNITYFTRFMNLCHFKISLGTATQSITTLSGFCRTFLNLVPNRFVPNMVWALEMSEALIGEFCIILFLTIDLNYHLDRRPIISLALREIWATVIYFLMKPSKLSRNFCTKSTSRVFFNQYVVGPFHPCWSRPPHTWCGQYSVRTGCHMWFRT